MSIAAIFPTTATSTTDSAPATKAHAAIKSTQIPVNITVKQTTVLNDGRTVVLYYQKKGTQCSVYSPCDLKGYNANNLSKVKSTVFEVTERVEGELYRTATMTEVAKIIKQIANNYL